MFQFWIFNGVNISHHVVIIILFQWVYGSSFNGTSLYRGYWVQRCYVNTVESHYHMLQYSTPDKKMIIIPTLYTYISEPTKGKLWGVYSEKNYCVISAVDCTCFMPSNDWSARYGCKMKTCLWPIGGYIIFMKHYCFMVMVSGSKCSRLHLTTSRVKLTQMNGALYKDNDKLVQ